MINAILLILFQLITGSTDIREVVKEFHDLKTEKSEIQFIEKYKQSLDPSVLAYVVSVAMKQAEYSYNPYYKIKIFKTNKKKLNTLLNSNKSNIHLRYVRLVAQENAPSILGYDDYIMEDKAFLKKKLDQKDKIDYLDKYIKANTSL
ncbi:MAG: hypothetical protein ACI93P_001813 [bacterium]|jgi:hypothetical protein